jgi:hypothetical protein
MRIALGLALLALVACRDEPTQTVVAIDAQDALRTAAPHLAIAVASLNGDDDPRALSPDASELPIKLVLAPKGGDAKRRFNLDLTATNDAGTTVLEVSLRSGFSDGAARYVSINLRDTCLAAGACTKGDCTTYQFEPQQLGASEQAARVVNVDCQQRSPSDPSSPSAVVGVGVDAGPNDLAPPAGGAPAPGSNPPMQTGDPAGGAAGSGSPDRADGGMNGISPCGLGFMRSGSTCVDIDECEKSPCGDNGRCVNHEDGGGYACECDSGFDNTTVTCVDHNECQFDNGGCQGTCVNTPGNAYCECDDDSWLQPDTTSCAKFSSALKLSSAQSTVRCQPEIAFDGDGSGIAVWIQSDGTNWTLWTDTYKPGLGWAAASKLPVTSTEGLDTPSLALDGKGHGVLVWVQSETMRKNLWSAPYAAGSFGTAARVETDDTLDVVEPTVAIDPNGNGYAIWTYTDGTHRSIWGNRWRSAGLGWAGARSIAGTDMVNASTGHVAFDGNGYGNLVWIQIDLTDGGYSWPSVWSSRYDPLLGWQTPLKLDDAVFATLPTVAVEPAGGGLALWQRWDTANIVVIARGLSGGAWGASSSISLTDSDIYPSPPAAQVALSPLGNGSAVWALTRDSGYEVWADIFDPATSQWGTATKLSPASSTFSATATALDPNGNGFALWFDTATGNARTIYAERILNSGGLTKALTLSSDVTPALESDPQLAIDSQGRALAIWDKQAPTQFEVWASRFE